MPRQTFNFPLENGSKVEINHSEDTQVHQKIEISADDPLFQLISQLKDGRYQLPKSALVAQKIETAIEENEEGEVEEMSSTIKNSISEDDSCREELVNQEEIGRVDSSREISDSDTFSTAARKVVRRKKKQPAASPSDSEEEISISSANEVESKQEKDEVDSDSSDQTEKYVSKTLHLELPSSFNRSKEIFNQNLDFFDNPVFRKYADLRQNLEENYVDIETHHRVVNDLTAEVNDLKLQNRQLREQITNAMLISNARIENVKFEYLNIDAFDRAAQVVFKVLDAHQPLISFKRSKGAGAKLIRDAFQSKLKIDIGIDINVIDNNREQLINFRLVGPKAQVKKVFPGLVFFVRRWCSTEVLQEDEFKQILAETVA